jgi:hypothetical protein
MFTEFIADLEPLRQRTARFRRVVLHLHSPDSHDWGRGRPTGKLMIGRDLPANRGSTFS